MTSAFGRFDHIRAVLFDLDGTLVDSAPDLAGAVDGMRVKRGLPSLPLVDYRPMAGAGARGMLGIAFGVAPDHPDFNALREEFFVAYEGRLTRDTQVFRGVSELLDSLTKQGLPWGVVTNKAVAIVSHCRRDCQWRHHTACQTPSRSPVGSGSFVGA